MSLRSSATMALLLTSHLTHPAETAPSSAPLVFRSLVLSLWEIHPPATFPLTSILTIVYFTRSVIDGACHSKPGAQ